MANIWCMILINSWKTHPWTFQFEHKIWSSVTIRHSFISCPTSSVLDEFSRNGRVLKDFWKTHPKLILDPYRMTQILFGNLLHANYHRWMNFPEIFRIWLLLENSSKTSQKSSAKFFTESKHLYKQRRFLWNSHGWIFQDLISRHLENMDEFSRICR